VSGRAATAVKEGGLSNVDSSGGERQSRECAAGT
jgi:hypothetical protein